MGNNCIKYSMLQKWLTNWKIQVNRSECFHTKIKGLDSVRIMIDGQWYQTFLASMESTTEHTWLYSTSPNFYLVLLFISPSYIPSQLSSIWVYTYLHQTYTLFRPERSCECETPEELCTFSYMTHIYSQINLLQHSI